MEMLDRDDHVLAETKLDHARFHHTAQNSVQFKAYEFIFLEFSI